MTDQDLDVSTLNRITYDGLFVGRMSKIGEFVKSWKVRHFSLTWKYISYFDPKTLEIIDSIPLSQGTEVIMGDMNFPYTFKLTHANSSRTYIFQVDNHIERTTWCRNLNTLIRMHDPNIKNYTCYEEITKIIVILINLKKAFSTLVTIHGETQRVLLEVFNELFGLLNAFTYSLSVVRSEKLIIAARSLKTSIVNLKQSIPVVLRYTFDGGFDISVEQRKIDRLLDSICLSPVDFPVGSEFTDDMKPFLIALVQDCHFS